MLAGSLGMLPSASLGERRRPSTARSACTSRSTAPRRTSPAADLANPIGTILSAAMLLRWSLGREDAAGAIESGGGRRSLDDGLRTADLCSARRDGRLRRRHDRDDRGDRRADRDYGGCAGDRRGPHVIPSTAAARRTPDR